MNRKKIIGIPIKNLDKAMSRLSEVINLKDRKKLQVELVKNLVNCFKNEQNDIFLISKDRNVEDLSKQLEVNIFFSNNIGLNQEIYEFSSLFEKYYGWMICHADLPYVTKHFAKTISQELDNNEILIAKSKDNGTPFIAGTKIFKNFEFGIKSFDKHIKYLSENKYKYSQIYSTEFTFELDDEDYLNGSYL